LVRSWGDESYQKEGKWPVLHARRAAQSDPIKPNQTKSNLSVWALGECASRKNIRKLHTYSNFCILCGFRQLWPWCCENQAGGRSIKPNQTKSNLRAGSKFKLQGSKLKKRGRNWICRSLKRAVESCPVKASQTSLQQVWLNMINLSEMLMFKWNGLERCLEQDDAEGLHGSTGLIVPLPKGGRDLRCWPQTT
jgi:hypothetical protein